MKQLCQRDPLWATLKLGKSNLTVGRWGCTTTCISGFRTPAELAQTPNLYTKDGLIIWQNIDVKNMKFAERVYAENPEKIEESLKDPNRAVILQVSDGAHWIVALRKTWFSKDYVCLDPWTGKTCVAKGDYRNITGSAHFVRK